ncbi:MAG TPA: T9SS type A sorting domain-containing protein [Sediminibacterium sp.]|nr:T9SS type A sorting domain-containing protein [Sediminibacterium sp.]
MNWRLNIFISLLLLLNQTLAAQNTDPHVINTNSGTYSKGNIILDWSFAEQISVQTLQADSGFLLTTGFLQSYSTPWGPFPQDGSKTGIFAFPNPSSSLVAVRSTIASKGKIQIRLLQLNGLLLQQFQEDYEGVSYQRLINISRYVSGIYMLHIVITLPDQTVWKITKQIIKI